MKKYLLIALLLGSAWGAQWQERANEEGVIVWTMQTPRSSIDAFRATVTLDVPLEKAVAFVEDASRSHEWIMYCEADKVIARTDDTHFVKHNIVDMPWPLSPRDSVANYTKTLSDDGNVVTITFISDPNLLPLRDDTVRIELLEGYWRFQARTPNRTHITYEVLSEPKNLPAWMVNMGLVGQPLTTMKNLKQKLQH
ncbi:MAG: hypothetical protein KU37_09865 [Sulfuricurvum sp. PC08-66]|nr:MAG: hypothetical protein KU37_09865 [Sulfuricurvum sp. PC08-66]